MLKVTSAKKQTSMMGDGEPLSLLHLPENTYEQLRADFKAAGHLSAIAELDLKGVGGVMVKAHHPEDGLLAASYVFRKYEADNGVSGNDDTASGDDDEAYPMDFDDDEDDEDEETAASRALNSLIAEDGTYAKLPVIASSEALRTFLYHHQHSLGDGPIGISFHGNTQFKKPYWLDGTFPVIISGEGGSHYPLKAFEYFEQRNRFYIYISLIPDERDAGWLAQRLESDERSLLFERNIEICRVHRPEVRYYADVLHHCAKAKGYRIGRSIDKPELIRRLIEFRGRSFRSNLDIETIVDKAIGKKRNGGPVLHQSDFTRLFEYKDPQTAKTPLRACEQLDRLIGLDDVKRQLGRIVNRMKFDTQRRKAGYHPTDTHAAAVFMGEPGTAKTTVARIFGQWLCEEGVLNTDLFREVARKDLVGRYVGWTAPAVAKVFEEAAGGTIFIDEAYSLMPEGNKQDPFAEEAMAEIIRQMENNPDTLVIFAGYTDEMRRFVQHANPGLRSRLTNMLEFRDYDAREMSGIFMHFVKQEDFVLDDPHAAGRLIERFVGDLRALRANNLGNGRLMRKLFKTAVGFMAEREDNDLKQLRVTDIEQAAAEIEQAEALVSRREDGGRRIGFV